MHVGEVVLACGLREGRWKAVKWRVRKNACKMQLNLVFGRGRERQRERERERERKRATECKQIEL